MRLRAETESGTVFCDYMKGYNEQLAKLSEAGWETHPSRPIVLPTGRYMTFALWTELESLGSVSGST